MGHCHSGPNCNFRHDDIQFPEEVLEQDYKPVRWSDTEDGIQGPGINPWDLYMAEKNREDSGCYAA
eukprot:9610575-Heterocapsa_arctica.AAC.1